MDHDDFEVLAAEPTPLGLICLQQRGMAGDPSTRVTEIALDHEFLMSSRSTVSEEALAREGLALCSGEDLRVLVGGLGLGYTAQAALRCDRVVSLEVMELLEPILRWHREGLTPLAGELSDDRVQLIQGDVYGRLLDPAAERYDALLIDVDHSPEEALGESSHSFHSADGLRRAMGHLRPGGVLGVWSYAQSPGFEAAMRQVFDSVVVRPVHFRNPVLDEDETNWLFFGRCPRS